MHLCSLDTYLLNEFLKNSSNLLYYNAYNTQYAVT